MSSNEKSVDKIFLGTVITLLVAGFTVFISASLGILAKNSTQFASIATKQIIFGIDKEKQMY